MATVPYVSVCIPAFNHEKYIGAAIDSVLSQTMEDFEIVITDDASTDGTRHIVQSYKDSRIRFFSMPKNSGPGATANNNFSHARGKLIALLASDDIFVPNKLERQVSFLDSNPDYGAVFSWMTYVDESDNEFTDPPDRSEDIENRSQSEWLRYLFFEGNPFSAPTALLRRSVLQSVGPMNPRLLQIQDMELWIRMCMKTKLHILPERLIRYRIRDGSANASANTARQQARTYWEFSKIYGLFGQASPDLFDAAFAVEMPEHARTLPREAQLAILALSARTPFAKSFGLDLAYSLLGETALLAKLDAAGLNYPWLFRMAAEADPFQVTHLEWLKKIHSEALTEVAQLKESIGATDLTAEHLASKFEKLQHAHAITVSDLDAANRILARIPATLKKMLKWGQKRH